MFNPHQHQDAPRAHAHAIMYSVRTTRDRDARPRLSAPARGQGGGGLAGWRKGESGLRERLHVQHFVPLLIVADADTAREAHRVAGVVLHLGRWETGQSLVIPFDIGRGGAIPCRVSYTWRVPPSPPPSPARPLLARGRFGRRGVCTVGTMLKYLISITTECRCSIQRSGVSSVFCGTQSLACRAPGWHRKAREHMIYDGTG